MFIYGHVSITQGEMVYKLPYIPIKEVETCEYSMYVLHLDVQ